MPLRIVFMGTPEFAVPSLSILCESGYEIAAVITSMDKRGGRGRQQVLSSPVKRYAQMHQLPILQPPNLKNPDFVNALRHLNADLQVVVAFRMLPEVVWNMPPMGTMNLHGSLLPAYRGAAPINWAIINGESVTGVTTFLLKHTIDTGDILLQRSLDIGPHETAGELHDRMMYVGAELVLKSVRGLETGTIQGRPQPEGIASHAPKITHETCRINFNAPVRSVYDFIRGLSPHPAAWTVIDGKQLNVYRSQVISESHNTDPGTIRTENMQFDIACQDGFIRLVEVQLQGKRKMTAQELLNGLRIQPRSVDI